MALPPDDSFSVMLYKHPQSSPSPSPAVPSPLPLPLFLPLLLPSSFLSPPFITLFSSLLHLSPSYPSLLSSSPLSPSLLGSFLMLSSRSQGLRSWPHWPSGQSSQERNSLPLPFLCQQPSSLSHPVLLSSEFWGCPTGCGSTPLQCLPPGLTEEVW